MTGTKNPLKSNAAAIQEAREVQDQTRAALERIRQQTAQTEDLGESTMQGLRENRMQMEKIEVEAQSVESKLNQTARMQDRLDRWGLRWGGRRNKREARAEAEEQTARERKLEKLNREYGASIKGEGALRATEENKVNNTRLQKSKLVVKRPPKKNPVVDSALGETDKTLDAETKDGLVSIAQTDDDLDAMIDQTAASLDRLADLSNAIKEETLQQNERIDEVTTSMKTVHEKQAVANARTKRFMGGKWMRSTPTT